MPPKGRPPPFYKTMKKYTIDEAFEKVLNENKDQVCKSFGMSKYNNMYQTVKNHGRVSYKTMGEVLTKLGWKETPAAWRIGTDPDQPVHKAFKDAIKQSNHADYGLSARNVQTYRYILSSGQKMKYETMRDVLKKYGYTETPAQWAPPSKKLETI
jgi:hypothetical protein